MRAFLTLSLLAVAIIGCGKQSSVEAPGQSSETVRGVLSFESQEASFAGLDRGRAAGSRKCIAGGLSSTQRAVWSFKELPFAPKTATSGAVPLVFTFETPDIAKGVENRGVDVNIRVVTWRCSQVPPPVNQKADGTWRWGEAAEEKRYEERAKDLLFAADQKREPGRRRFGSRDAIANAKAILSNRDTVPGTADWAVANELAEEFGFYEIAYVEVLGLDHTVTISVPTGLFENALTDIGGAKSPPPAHRLKVYIRCWTSG